MANILILGGNGFIGRNLVRVIKDHNINIHIYDTFLEESHLVSKVKTHLGELSDVDNLTNIIDNNEIDIVIHMVSRLLPYSNFRDYMDEFSSVILPTITLLKHLSSRKIKLIYLSSGGTVYGNSGITKITENHETSPICYYGQSKKLLEDIILFESRKSGLEYLILRPSNIYGPGQRTDGVQGLIATSIYKVLNAEKLVIWGDGTAVRDYLYIDDLCNAINEMILNFPKNEIFNISSGLGYSVNEVLNEIMEQSGHDSLIEYSPGRSTDVDAIVLDNTKLHQIVQFNPMSLRNGITLFFNYLKKEDIE